MAGFIRGRKLILQSPDPAEQKETDTRPPKRRKTKETWKHAPTSKFPETARMETNARKILDMVSMSTTADMVRCLPWIPT